MYNIPNLIAEIEKRLNVVYTIKITIAIVIIYDKIISKTDSKTSFVL